MRLFIIEENENGSIDPEEVQMRGIISGQKFAEPNLLAMGDKYPFFLSLKSIVAETIGLQSVYEAIRLKDDKTGGNLNITRVLKHKEAIVVIDRIVMPSCGDVVL